MQQDKMAYSISCLCRKVTQQVLLDPSNNDHMLSLCHCTSCQTVSGQLCTSYYLLQTEPQSLDSLERYQQSDCISRYFCGTCGAHAFAHSNHTGRYFVASGLVDTPPQTKAVCHWGYNDTRDGGLTSFLPGEVGEKTVPCLLHSSSDSQQSNAEKTKLEVSSQDSSQLLARCHCGGVELYITKPDSTSTDAWSPWPDIIVPYYLNPDLAENKDDVKWWLRDEKTKYLAGTCACRTCRLASGFPIQSWVFVPKSNILTASKSPLGYDVGTMKRYESTPNIYREFCSRCGASVFWHCAKRPLIVDVSVGLLHAESGTRAEGWLDWATGRTSFAELAVDVSLIRQLEAGLKAWGEQTGGRD